MQIEKFRNAQRGEWLRPDFKGARRTLLQEHNFPICVPKSYQIAIVVEVEEILTCALRLFTAEVGELIVAVEMNLESLSRCSVAVEQLFFDVWVARSGEQCWAPVEAAHDFVGE